MMGKKNNNPMSYVKTLGNAMGAWRDENKDKRSFIVLAMSENEDTTVSDDSRSIAIYSEGTKEQYVDLIYGMLRMNKEFRQGVSAAIHLLIKNGLEK